MKELDLSIGHTSQISFDFRYLSQSPDTPGEHYLGTYNIIESLKASEMARKNGGHVMYGAIEISQKIERVIANYLFGAEISVPAEKSFFQNEFMESSQINFQFKKEIFKKIVVKLRILEGKAKHDFFTGLDDIAKWRNAFAHGQLIYDEEQKVVILKYYANEHKMLKLSDPCLNNMQEVFKLVNLQLDTLIENKF